MGSRDNLLDFIYSPTHESLSHKDGFTSDVMANLKHVKRWKTNKIDSKISGYEMDHDTKQG